MCKFNLSDEYLKNNLQRFNPNYGDSCGYFGQVPSEAFLKRVLIREVERKLGYYFSEVQRRIGKMLYIDHSHKVKLNLIRLLNIYTGLTTQGCMLACLAL